MEAWKSAHAGQSYDLCLSAHAWVLTWDTTVIVTKVPLFQVNIISKLPLVPTFIPFASL